MFEIIQSYFDAVSSWYSDLSTTGKYIFPIAALALLGFIFVAVQTARQALILLRRFIRRKRIPKNVDLHLDRENVPPKIEPTFSDLEDHPEEIVHGSTLRDRIEKMRENAPFKKR